MPLGLVRPGNFSNGFPVVEPLVFGTPINLITHNFGNPVTLPLNFGNIIGAVDELLQEDGVSFFLLENGIDSILLEN